jgi:NADPH-dependent 2,4-dienoyl-CoA reductase/sulfur reductase-like enzyme
MTAVPERVDVAIIGAGPAGMSAAIAASRAGAAVAVLDEQPAPGGQVYRGVADASDCSLAGLGQEYRKGRALAERFASSAATYIPSASVWQVTPDRVVSFSCDGEGRELQADRVVLCTGAMERPFPIPGWTLPGVFTAGAGQTLLKSAELVPAEPPLLVGCGPLLYLLATQYLRANVPIRALVDTTGARDFVRAAIHLPAALAAAGDLKSGLDLLRVIRKSGIPVYRGASDLAIEGSHAATGLRFTCAGSTERIAARVILLHQGVVPNTQITWSLRARHSWHARQLCWVPDCSASGELSTPGIYVAGDNGGIVGAGASAIQGHLVGLAAADACGHPAPPDDGRSASTMRRQLLRHLRLRPLLDVLYQPKPALRIPADDVIVCRCEEVTAGEIRRCVALGCTGPAQVKVFNRCGMGPCQGRNCGLTVTELIAAARNLPPAEIGYFRIRAPIKPITLGELAGTG